MNSCLCQLFGVAKKSLERRVGWPGFEFLHFQCFICVTWGSHLFSLNFSWSVWTMEGTPRRTDGIMWATMGEQGLRAVLSSTPWHIHTFMLISPSIRGEVGPLPKVRRKALFISIEHRWTLPTGTSKIILFKYDFFVIKSHFAHTLFEKMTWPYTKIVKYLTLFDFSNH